MHDPTYQYGRSGFADQLMIDEQPDIAHRSPTEALRAFDALTNEQKASLAESVFFVLEYDDFGEPGYEWSSDTFGRLALVFADWDVTFTPPTSDGS